MSGQAPAPARGRGRSSLLAVPLLAVGAVALWGASRMTWVRLTSFDGLGAERDTALIGGTWAAALTPLALTLVAAIAASFAVRGWALRVLAVLIAAVAVAAAIPAVGLLTQGASDERAAQLAELPARANVTATEITSGPAALTLVGAACAIAAAAALFRKAGAGSGLSSKYDSPAARRDAATRRPSGGVAAAAAEPVTERMLWDALDAGRDPTVEDPDPSASNAPNGTNGTNGTHGPGTRR